MATKINNIELMQILQGFNKPYFTVADFEKILEMDKNSLYVTLNRLEKKGVLARLKRGVYISKSKRLEIERIANELYYPSYLSFESVLSKYGVMSQIPFTFTYATSKASKKLTLARREIEYRKLKDEYFFGYMLRDGVYVAEPEKAILDQLYMISKGKVQNNISEWTLVNLNKQKFLEYSKRFPKPVQKKAKTIIPKFGTYMVGIN